METARAGTAPAPDESVTVAPFRAWRGWRVIVAEKPARAAIDEKFDIDGRKRARTIAETIPVPDTRRRPAPATTARRAVCRSARKRRWASRRADTSSRRCAAT